MEALLITLVAVFLITPLPVCMFLVYKRGQDLKRIQTLEQTVDTLSQANSPTTEQTQAPIPVAAEPTPPSTLVFTDEPEESPADPIPEPSVPPPIPQAAKTTPAPEPQKVPTSSPVRQPTPAAPVFIPFLRSIGLWPPADALHAEAGLMQWWLPRIGGLLATFFIISGAVYLGQKASPWLRFCELLLADVALLIAAIVFLKRIPKFGNILLSTALSMFYLTSIAAYAAPPVRVIDSSTLGILIQFVLIAGIFAVSLLRKDRNIGIIALIYGYTSSLYSSYLGLNNPALISALSLYLAGIFINRSFNSKAILSLSSIGVYAPVLSTILLNFLNSTTLTLPTESLLFGFLFISVSILPLRELLKSQFDTDTWTHGKIHAGNTTLFLGLGYLYLKTFTTQLTLFYGISALLLLSFAALFSRRGLSHFLFQLFFLKGLTVASLWFVNYFEGDIRWFALALQAPLVAWVAGRSKSVYQEVACYALWIASTILAFESRIQVEIEMFSVAWFILLSQPILTGLFLSHLFDSLKTHSFRTTIYTIAALLNGLFAFVFLLGSGPSSAHFPAYLGLYSLIFAAIAFAPRLALFPASVTGALMVFLANYMFWSNADSFISFLLVIALAATAAYASASYAKALKGRSFIFLEYAFHLAWFISLYAFLSEHFQDHLWFSFFPALASLTLLVVPAAGSKTIRDLSLAPLALYIFYPGAIQLGEFSRPLAIAAYLVPLFATRFAAEKEKDFGLFTKGESWRVLLHLLVYVILIRFTFDAKSWLSLTLPALGISLALYGLWLIHRHVIAFALSLVTIAGTFSMMLFSRSVPLIGSIEAQPWPTEILFSGLALSATALAISIIHSRISTAQASDASKTILSYAGALTAYFSIALTLSHRELELMEYFTPLVALFCLILVGLGFGLKNKPFRFIALAGFLLPLGRLFVHDIRDTLTRIIAFGILALLFFLITYLYHRFQNRID